MTERYCPLCTGMVNGNGCDRQDCPMRPQALPSNGTPVPERKDDASNGHD